MIKHILKIALLMLTSLIVVSASMAQNTVVVIPLAGDDYTPPQFRIVGRGTGTVQFGRLEYTADKTPDVNSLWGTVCADVFENNSNAANAICKDLGYSSGGTPALASPGFFDAGTGFIILDDVLCPNGAESFSNCSHRPYFTHDCDHSRDIGISCTPNAPPMPLVDSIQFRIIPEPGGAGVGDGRLEAKYNDSRYPAWGTVCDDNFTNNQHAANAICQDLGYQSGMYRVNFATTDGEALQNIFLDGVVCPSGASSFTSCASVVLDHDCTHSEDVGVTCSN